MAKICIQLAPVLGVPVLALETSLTETEILDYWFAYLETRGVEVKSPRVVAEEEGFTKKEVDRVVDIMRGI